MNGEWLKIVFASIFEVLWVIDTMADYESFFRLDS